MSILRDLKKQMMLKILSKNTHRNSPGLKRFACLRIVLKNRAHQYDTLFLVCVSLSPLAGGRQRRREGAKTEKRWDFSPLVSFFSSSINSSRAAECHLLSHNWSRNEWGLCVAACVNVDMCVSESGVCVCV